eukprot:1188814-Prorocentrum_minimum.AAC.1
MVVAKGYLDAHRHERQWERAFAVFRAMVEERGLQPDTVRGRGVNWAPEGVHRGPAGGPERIWRGCKPGSGGGAERAGRGARGGRPQSIFRSICFADPSVQLLCCNRAAARGDE